MTSKLKPCPFCGGVPSVQRGKDEDGEFIYIGCTGCGCATRQFYPLMDDATPSAAGAWNLRCPASSMAAPTLTIEMRNAAIEAAWQNERTRISPATMWKALEAALSAAPAVPSDPKIEGMK